MRWSGRSLGVFNAISSAVNHAWGVEKKRNFWQHRLFSFLMLLRRTAADDGAALATAVQVVEARWFASYHWSSPQLAMLPACHVRYAMLLLPAFVFGLIYYFVPHVTRCS